jgi:hypothetical protein
MACARVELWHAHPDRSVLAHLPAAFMTALALLEPLGPIPCVCRASSVSPIYSVGDRTSGPSPPSSQPPDPPPASCRKLTTTPPALRTQRRPECVPPAPPPVARQNRTPPTNHPKPQTSFPWMIDICMDNRKYGHMKKKIPTLNGDTAAEEFVADADLTEYDLSGFRPVRFEFERKTSLRSAESSARSSRPTSRRA